MADTRFIVVLDALVAALATITTGNGYEQTVNRVYVLDEIPEQAVLPAIFLEPIVDTYTTLYDPTQHNQTQWSAVCIQAGWNERIKRALRFVADVHKALRAQFEADRFGGNVLDYLPSTMRPFYDVRFGQEISGARFDFTTQYRADGSNPYTLTP